MYEIFTDEDEKLLIELQAKRDRAYKHEREFWNELKTRKEEVIDYLGLQNAVKIEERRHHAAILDSGERDTFIERLDCKILREELEIMKDRRVHNFYPRYLLGVMNALIISGFDKNWVNGEFKCALDTYYLGLH